MISGLDARPSDLAVPVDRILISEGSQCPQEPRPTAKGALGEGASQKPEAWLRTGMWWGRSAASGWEWGGGGR